MKLFDAFREYIINHKTEAAYKPSSSQYDGNKLFGILERLSDDSIEVTQEETDKVLDFVHISDYLHSILEKFYTTVETRLSNFNMKGEDIIEFFIAFLNREWKTVLDKIMDAQEKQEKGHYLFQDIVNQKLELEDGTKLSVLAVMEGATEAISQICNFLRHSLDIDYKNASANPQCFTAHVRDIFQMADIVATFKHSYDNVLYGSSYVKMDMEEKKIAFIFENERKEILEELGHRILEERILGVECRNRASKIKSELVRFVTNYRVKRIKVTAGYVTLEFGQGDPRRHLELVNETQAAIDAYYEYLDMNTQLEGLNNITISEVLGVWIAIQYISREVLGQWRMRKGTIYTKDEMADMPRKIRINDLITYVVKLTGIKPHRVKIVVDAVEVDWNSYNDIWVSPLYKIKDYYCLPLYPIIHAMPFNIIETLMQRGGYNLEKRGVDFEKYVYKIISEAKHQYEVTCVASKEYGLEKEEIDLIVGLRDVVVLAEAKCIHYSMEPQNYRDAWNRLKAGAEQAKKKKEFMRTHPELFAEFVDLNRKTIIPVVLTNYPIFTGFEHKGVYVIDSHSFVSYFNTGILTMREASISSSSIKGINLLYRNETEFSSKFVDYVKDNPIKKIHMERMMIKEIPLLSQIAPWKCSAQTAVYMGNPGFDITNGPQANS